jgi:pilus assembly protein CpaF
VFLDDDHVMRVIDRIVSPLGRRIDESSPTVDARLPDGSRVNAIIPPIALGGPTVTIRKFSKDPFTVEDLIRFGTFTAEMATFLKACVEARLNIIVAGGTGSGKTTFLNVLSSFIPADERIVTIENAAELQLRQEHVVRLESRPANIEGKGEITIRDLVINSLRMRPERIVVGECRGGEALDMLQAMNTGHDGSMTTAHANSPRDTLSRLETMCLMAGMDLPVRAIREQIASAVDLIVQQERLKDGTRKVTGITEVQGMEGDVIVMQDIFTFQQSGIENGKIVGRMKPTGIRPKFMPRFEVANIYLPPNIFGAGVVSF